MKHNLILIIIFLFAFTICNAQKSSNEKRNAVSFELGKTGLIYNVNFDHKFRDKNFGVRFGVGSNLGKYLQAFTGGGGGYYLMGHSKDLFELGIDVNYFSVDEISDDQRGITLIYPNFPIKTYYVSGNIGYRRYGAKTLFRIGVSPGFIKDKFLPGGYISYGWRFN